MFYTLLGMGQPIVVLSGGPGDACGYMTKAVSGLLNTRQAVLFDQRGTGQHRMKVLDTEDFVMSRLLEDIEALRQHLGVGQLELLGHSWGANLALLYAAFYPAQTKKVLAVAPGPINSGFAEVAGANIRRHLSAQEQTAQAALRAARAETIATQDVQKLRQLHGESVRRFWSKGAIYNAEARSKFCAEFNENDFEPMVHRLIHSQMDWDALEPRLKDVQAEVSVVYGYQDFEPITQAYRIRELVPQTTLHFLNECGHLPWLEQPYAYNAIARKFFQA